MNKYIIDTHILLWLIFKPDQIKKSKLVVLEDTDNEIFATSISFWEISLKYGLGKLDLQGLEPKNIPIVTKEMGMRAWKGLVVISSSRPLSVMSRQPVVSCVSMWSFPMAPITGFPFNS